MTTVPTQQRSVAYWLLCCCALVFVMIVLGGVTRLTGSGLSMVEWGPIMGTIPPLSDADWQTTFEKYQQYPEYALVNMNMTLEGFKSIFWFEYAHRILGRSIGIAFLFPFLYFLARKKIAPALTPRLVLVFFIGGLQGLLGWYMVKSGLVDNPHVSQYRLTAHLSLAFLIYGYMFWIALGLLFPGKQGTSTSGIWARRTGIIATVLVCTTILSGGFVAGLKAGLAYNTFPLMDGHWFPEAYFALQPWWINLFENIAAVQFDHRLLAMTTLVIVVTSVVLGWRESAGSQARVGLIALVAMVVIQALLGISTLLLHMPVTLAALHQAGAVILFTIALFTNHALR